MIGPDSNHADREERLGELFSDWLESLERGEKRDRQEWLARHPEFAAELEEFLTQEERMQTLAAPLRETAQAALAATPAPGEPLLSEISGSLLTEPLPGPFGDYELLEEIGRGGMAVVYRARQTGLGRFVALKLFRSDPPGRISDLQRFRHEAEVVAHLDHPLIVPIHDVGEHQGHVYYTMKLIEGGGLDTQLDHFTAAPRAAATLLAAVARAVHHAHQRGILHRDLKPSNILLSGSRDAKPSAAEGAICSDPSASWLHGLTPMVTDFGLAKRIGTDLGLTHSGAVVGTPAYMAPEQAASEKNAITTATDVYGLGAVLYALLAGKAPFAGGSVLETLEQVKERDPLPPSRTNPKVPSDLETICLKCLRKEPTRRYESAAALADDLERWLRGEPILARPVGRLERLVRWCRRRPAQAALGTSLLLVVVTGFVLVLWQWRRAEDNYEAAEVLRREAVARQVEIEESFRLAHEAVKDFTTRPEGGGLLEAHGLDPLRRELMQKAQTYYKKFLQRRGQDPTLRRELAEVSARLADVLRQTGTPEEAQEAYRRALAQYESLLKDDPQSLQLHLDLARLHSQFGAVQQALDRHDDAVASMKRARAVLEEALATHPSNVSLQAELASNHHNLGMFHRAANRVAAALASFASARRIYEKLLRTQPDDIEFQRLLASTLNSTAVVHEHQGRPTEALPLFREAVALSNRLAGRYPDKRALQHALAQHLANLGECLHLCGQPKEARTNLDRARTLLEGVTRTSPHVTDYQVSLGLCCAVLGRTRLTLKEPGEAVESFEKARLVFRQLVGEYPGIVDYQRRLFQVLVDLALTHSHMKRPARSLSAYKEARDVAVRLAARYPDQPEDASRLGLTWNNLAVAHAKLGQLKEAHAAVLQAVTWQRRAFERAPEGSPYGRHLADHYALLAVLARKLDRTEEALDATQQRLKLLKESSKRPQ